MNIEELYSLGRLVPDSLKYKNKYTWLAHSNILEMRYLDVNDIMRRSTPINGFVSEHGSVLMIPNMVNKKMADLTVKALNSKSILRYKNVKLPYGVGQLKDFKYGDPLILVEGIADLAGLKLVNKDLNVVALRTNSISQDMYQVYKTLTNHIVLLLDNDKAGQRQVNKTKFNLAREGIQATVIEQHADIKDTGEIVELFMRYDKTRSSDVLLQLQNLNVYYKAQISLLSQS